MDILPAIDLKDGKAVRLTKGLMDTAKIYSDEPWMVAKHFEELGSRWLHLVDLNGAFAGEPKNLEQIKKIRQMCDIQIELGGGIRDEDTIKRYLDLGVNRIILGSVALKNADFVKDVARKYHVSGYPTIYLIDKNGKIILGQVGYAEGVEEELEKIIKENL